MHGRASGYIAIAAASLAWSVAPVFIRYLSNAYDPYTQAFVRYLDATAALMLLCLVFYRAPLRAALANVRATGGLALVNIVMQVLLTASIYHTTATSAALITKLQIVFVIVLSYLLFHEERAVIRNPKFLAGTAMGLLGVWGVLLEHPETGLLPQLNYAAVGLILVSVAWAVYAVYGKHVVSDIQPIPLFGAVAVYTTAGLFVVALVAGHPWDACTVDARIALLTFVSGVVPIAIAHCSFHYAQRELGASFCGSMILTSPLFTHLIAIALWPDEWMNAWQWTGAGVLLTGSYLVIRAKART